MNALYEIFSGVKIGIKGMFRDKMTFFWNSIFPLFLITIMVLVFKSIGSDFEKIPVGMKVSNPSYTISKSIEYLEIKEPSDNIIQDFKDKKYVAFVNDDLSLEIPSNGSKIMVVKNIFESIKQFNETKIDKSELFKTVGKSYIDYSKQENDIVNTILYSILLMTSMYTMFGTVESTQNILLDGNEVSMRILTAPIKKSRYLMYSIIATIIIQSVNLLIAILYMNFVLGANAITNYPMTFLILIVTMLFSSVLGVFISVYIKGNTQLKAGIGLGAVMIMTQLSGMIGVEATKAINNAIPVLSTVNPAQYLNDALVAVNKVNSISVFKNGILFVLIITAVLFLLSVLKLRRVNNDF